MVGTKWGMPFRRFSAAYVTFRSHNLELRRDVLSGSEGGWPLNTRRVRCGTGEIDEHLWTWEDFISGRQELPPAGADGLAKKNRMHHYQRIRTAEECKLLCQRNLHCGRATLPYLLLMGYNEEVIHNLGDDPARQLKFAIRLHELYGLRAFAYREFVLDRRLQAAATIIHDLDSPLAFLDVEGNKVLPPHIVPEHGIRASFEITEQWRKPAGGVIELPAPGDKIVGVHDIAIGSYDEDRHCFVFVNTWGQGWGDGGIGYLPYEYFDRYVVESWTFGFPDVKPSFVETDGVQVLRWESPDLFGGTLYGREVYDRTDDEKMGWLFAVVRDGHLDVEELFVRPEFRSEGWGARLADEARTLASSLALPLRAYVPFADADTDDDRSMRKLIDRLGLVLQPSGVRWAAYRAVPAGEALATEVVARIPPRPTHAFGDEGKADESDKAPATNRYHCRAEMEEEVEVDQTVSVEITVSPNFSNPTTGRATAGGELETDPDKKIIATVVARKNFVAVGDSRFELDHPAHEEVRQFFFDVRATDLGRGEVWVVIRQGATPLLTLELRPMVVPERVRPVGRTWAVGTGKELPPTGRPLHQLTIYEQENGGAYSFRYELRCPELGILLTSESPKLSSARSDYISRIYARIEEFWASCDDDEEEYEANLRSYGGELFDQLLPPELQAVLWDYRDRIDSILVVSTEPFIPWELVHVKQPGRPLPEETLFLCQMGLVRWIHNTTWPPQAIRVRDGQVSYVKPLYLDPAHRLAGADEETLFLEDVFQAAQVPARPNELRRLMRRAGSFDLLHFACHGMAESGKIDDACLFLDDKSDGDLITPTRLSPDLVSQYSDLLGSDGNRPIVTVNACQAGRSGHKMTGTGGFAQAFIRRGAGMFVGALWSVDDQQARTFIESFYRALLDGNTLSGAASEARNAARGEGGSTWIAYTVYGHPHARISRT